MLLSYYVYYCEVRGMVDLSLEGHTGHQLIQWDFSNWINPPSSSNNIINDNADHELVVCNRPKVILFQNLFVLLAAGFCFKTDFSNVISKQDVKILAEADDQEAVREVQVCKATSRLNC